MNNQIKDAYSKIRLDYTSQERLLSHILQMEQPKKHSYLIPAMILSICLLCIIAYPLFNNSPSPIEPTPQVTDTPFQIDEHLLPLEAKEKGYYVRTAISVYNHDKIEEFLNLYNQGKPAEVICALYTDEGDPIYYSLQYQKTVIIQIDSRQDRFGERQLLRFEYKHFGYYQNAFYAYNTVLDETTIDTDQCLHLFP